MSIASQQRVIEGHQATIKNLKQQVTQAKANERDGLSVYVDLTDLCDEYEVAGQKVIPIALLRQIRPRGHGVT